MYEPTLRELANKCLEWEIRLDPEKLENTLNKVPKTEKYSRWDLTKIIINKSIREYYGDKIPRSAIHRNRYESAMLCARFPELKEADQRILMTDNNEYYGEQKFNGFRTWIYIVPEEGLKFYANNRDTDTLLVTDNTPQVLLIKDNKVYKPEDFKGKCSHMIVLDAEIVVNTKYVDATAYGGEMTDSELNAVGTLMQIDPEVSHEIQRTQKDCQLQFRVFDIVYCDKDLMNLPLKQRNKIRDEVFAKIINQWNLPFENVQRIYTDKQGLFDRLTESGKEGIVIKNENEIYTPNKTRSKVRQIKYKRTISGMLGDDIDGFIIGFEPSTEGKAFENYIGAVKIGVYLSTVEGNEVLHHIATISGMPMNIRQDMTVIDKDTGKPTLNPEYLDRVLTFDGFDVKTKSLRFSHARVNDWNTCWRPDKNKYMCQVNEEILRMLAL